MPFTIDQIIQAEQNLTVDQNDSYLVSYPEIINHFAGINHFSVHDLVICAHIVYGWMPTILELKGDGEYRAIAAEILHVARDTGEIDITSLKLLKYVVNNSVVGPSKLLHFLRPDKFPIWDSRVCRFIFGVSHQNIMGNPETYLEYMDNCGNVVNDARFDQVSQSVNHKVGYPVTKIRAVELIMYGSTD